MIFNGLRMDALRDHPEIMSTLLAVSITKHLAPTVRTGWSASSSMCMRMDP